MELNLQIINLQVSNKDEESSTKFSPILIDLTNKKEENVKSEPIKLTIPETTKDGPELVPLEIINTNPDSSFNSGYITKIPSIPLTPTYTELYLVSDCIKEDSIMDTVKPGFGIENILRRECKKPKYKQHLCKENYLGEFEAETEKQLARTNLGIYSKKEVNSLLEQLVETHSKDFVTHTLVKQMLADLDFVDSELKALSNYEIPQNLFKL